jgi:S1-C subfamily serine protease
MHIWQAILLLGCFNSFAASSEPTDLDGRAQVVFAAAKDSVVQIRTLLKGSQSQNSIGSGFYVSDDGLVITNYHVVASHALEPKTYEMAYVASNGERGSLVLLAIDVLHDLALLQRKGSQLPYLNFHAGSVAKGEKLFSLGNPNDLGLVIVEGVNNGLSEHSFYDTIHFTGAINSGMSGGPVVNKSGDLVGINDATMGESRGFLVPAQFAHELLARWRAAPVVAAEFQPEITRQLKQHSSALVERLAHKPLPVQSDAGYAVPDAADPYMRCWANESNDAKLFYSMRSYSCSGRSSVYVGQGINMGSVNFESNLYQSDKLDAFRFGRVLEKNYGRQEGSSTDVLRKHFSKYACTDSLVDLNGMQGKAVLCLRAYRKFPGLYDIKLKVVTLRASKNALVSRLNLSGVAYEDGVRMVRQYLGVLKWNG